MRETLIDHNYSIASSALTTTATSALSLVYAETFSVQCVIDVDTPGAKTFASTAVNTTDDTITIAAHGLPSGLKGQVSNPGTLPTGIVALTDYFVIVVDANTIKLASSYALSQAGTAIDITAQGSGTNTFTPTAIAGGTVKLQKSNDGTNWSDEGSATNVTADATVFLEKIDPCAKWMRVVYTLTAGSISSSNYVIVKGDEA